MNLNHSTHVNDAHILEIAPGAFASSADSSHLGRRRVGFRPSFSTLGGIVLRSRSPSSFETGQLSPLPDQPHNHLFCSTRGHTPPTRPRSRDRSTPHARP